MTPEEFRERAGAAVGSVEPDGRSYQWLTRNVAKRSRRRRATWAAATTATVAVAGVAVAVVPREDARPPLLDASPASPAATSAAPSATPSPAAPGDVDGDGRPDEVRIVNGTPWRVEVRGSAGGVQALAITPGTEDGDSREIAGVEDVNGDGHGEVFVRLARNGSRDRDYLVATLVRGTALAWVRDEAVPGPLRFRHTVDGTAWGCRANGAHLYGVTVTKTDRGVTGIVNRHELIDELAVPLDSIDELWAAGAPYPRPYHLDVRCGSITAPAPAPRAETSPSAPPAPVASDIDGDGKADKAEIVERGTRANRTWQWGVRATMTALGVQTVWHPVMQSSNEAQYLDGIVDVNGDGRSEVSVSPGGTAFGDFFSLYTVVDGKLVEVEGAMLVAEKRPGEQSGWGCDMGRVAVGVATTSDGKTWRGTRKYYELERDELVEKQAFSDRWTTPSGSPHRIYVSDGC